jgi:hypothetical protein
MDIIITAGQSNFANFYTVLNTTPPDINVSSRGLTGQSPWRNAYDPQPVADGVNSSVFPILGNLIVGYTKKPIGFINLGVSNSTVSSWAPNGANYSRIQSALSIADGPIIAFLWQNGETDSANGASQNSYATSLKAMIDQMRIDAGSQIPCGISITSHPNEATGAGVRAAQIDVGTTYTGCFQGANTDTLNNSYRTDTIHFNSTTGRDSHAGLWFNALRAAGLLHLPVGPVAVPTSPVGVIFTRDGVFRS